jgi:hypothetical protein
MYPKMPHMLAVREGDVFVVREVCGGRKAQWQSRRSGVMEEQAGWKWGNPSVCGG